MTRHKTLAHSDLVLPTPAQMGEADRAAEAAGASGPALMEAAGGSMAAAEVFGVGLVAQDLPDALPRVLHALHARAAA